MNLSFLVNRLVAAAFLLLCLVAPLAGCSKSNPPVSMSLASFDSAPAELKARWHAASEAAVKNDYMGTATNLMAILDNPQSLTAEQTAALNQAWLELGNKAFQAADNGDEKATKAVLEIRNSKFGGMKNGR